MAYTGTGTQTDPYIVDNWADFKSLCGTSGVFIAFDPNAEHRVIDLNDTKDREGLQANLVFLANVEGNDWIIRNLVTNGCSLGRGSAWYTGTITVQNLHFENLIAGGGSVFDANFHFTGCRFSGCLLDGAILLDPLSVSGGYMEKCACNLYASNAATTLFSYTKMIHCSLHLTGKLHGNICAGGQYTWMENCRLSGEIDLNGGTLDLGTSRYDANTVVMLHCRGTGTVTAGNAAASPCILDAELMADTVTVDYTLDNRFALTTAQMQNADYLMNTIGFPCVEVTS